MQGGKDHRNPDIDRAVIERQLEDVRASIASAEIAAEEQSARVSALEATEQGAAKSSDPLVELLIARLLRVAYRDSLLRNLARQFVTRFKEGQAMAGISRDTDGSARCSLSSVPTRVEAEQVLTAPAFVSI